MELHVLHVDSSVVFEFSKPMSFDIFVVSSSDEQVFWELSPHSLQPVPIMDAKMFGIRVPVGFESLAEEAIREVVSGDDEQDALVSRVVYGEVPLGYRAVTEARPLKQGVKYCVLVVGQGFERAAEYFFA